MAADRRPPHLPDTATGLRQLEGYLYWQAETDHAQREAERIADRLPWLTTGQREDVVQLLCQERLLLSRDYIERITDRVGQLQCQYSARYRHLKIRLLATALAGAVCLIAAALVAWPRP